MCIRLTTLLQGLHALGYYKHDGYELYGSESSTHSGFYVTHISSGGSPNATTFKFSAEARITLAALALILEANRTWEAWHWRIATERTWVVLP